MRVRCSPCGLLLPIALIAVIYYLQRTSLGSIYQKDNVYIEHNLTKLAFPKITRSPGYLSVCNKISIQPWECDRYHGSERQENRTYPFQVVSGAPGSGNDWILWLASLSGYTLSRVDFLKKCEVYARKTEYEEHTKEDGRVPSGSNISTFMRRTDCLFLKSHEPWFNRSVLEISGLPVRATLLLRHPYDAAFADYKRSAIFLSKTSNEEKRKQASTGFGVKHIFDVTKNTTKRVFMDSVLRYLRSWLRHARYWLEEYNEPLHVFLYNSVRQNTAMEVENMQRFFGYKFDGKNLRRHCCVMKHPMNPNLKRNPSKADIYKEIVYVQEKDLSDKFELATKQVNELLAYKYPQRNYTCTRG